MSVGCSPSSKYYIKEKKQMAMKNRKTIITAFLLVACMLIGVGYAALTDTLTITGDLKADTSVSQTDFEDDVYFSATSVVTDDTGNKAASQILEGRDDAKITAQHFTAKNQIVKVMYTIKNDSTDFAAAITPSANTVTVENADPSHNPIFKVEWSWDENSVVTGAAEIAAGASKNLWVTITLTETPIEAHTATFTVTYGVEAVDK